MANEEPLTDKDLLVECKIGLSMSPEPNEIIDRVINQKLLAVKSFMKGSGVSDETLNNALAVGAIVLGVTDLWNLKAGEVKFSPVFYTMVTQLSAR